ncbi:acyl-CoA dehydrogenase family protein [Streptomyces bacillaris]|uniref:acyl-CoA dehydrogenase family protein n=1 Tax=Streptomyces bacillaris TaxID=68179 RepID=UPI00346026CC
MDFTPSEDQAAAQGLAARIFGDLSTHERLVAAGTGTDAGLWKELCTAGLPGAVADIGLLGLVLLLEEQGRTTAQVPLAATCAYGILPVAEHGTAEQRERLLPALRDGTAVATGALPVRGEVTVVDGALYGAVPWVPWLRDATQVLVADAERGMWIVDTRAPGVSAAPVETTAPWSAGRLDLDGVRGESLSTGPGACSSVLAASRIAFAGLQAGVCAGSLARAVHHTTTREQFGRPLSTNQGVLLRAADAHMDTEAIRVTAYEAAWRYDRRLDHQAQALTAAWWASEAGRRVVHTGQHLHGGTGADLDHPVHRHFLWGRQLSAYLGCGGEVLEELGLLLAEGGRQEGPP